MHSTISFWRKRAVFRLIAFLPAFDNRALSTLSGRLSKLGSNFLSFIRMTDWKGICRYSILSTSSVYYTYVWKGAYGSRSRTIVGIPLSWMFKILRADGDLCICHGKAQSVGYIGTSITIDCNLIALQGPRRGMLGNPRCIRGTTPKDRSRSHPRNRHRRARRR